MDEPRRPDVVPSSTDSPMGTPRDVDSNVNTTNPSSDPPPVMTGWNQLRLQRPLAAWACWSRVLRDNPNDSAAKQALEALLKAPHLPHAARAVYRFRMPSIPIRRARWNAVLLARDQEDLDAAADVFAQLMAADPEDADAAFNHALCLAWLGHNADALAALDRVVRLDAATRPDQAAAAWVVAEVLRQGAGAERFADEWSHTLVMPRHSRDDLWIAQLEEAGRLRRFATPLRPDTLEPVATDLQVYELLDRALTEVGEPTSGYGDPDSTPPPPPSRPARVMCSVLVQPNELRFSSPDPESLRRVETFLPMLRPDASCRPVQRLSSPLPLNMLDAAAWLTRLPVGLPEDQRRRLAQEALDDYYRNTWIHQPRQGLEGLTPALAAESSDPVIRVRLDAILTFREQVDARSPVGWPLGIHHDFDDLRRRLQARRPDATPRLDQPHLKTQATPPELDRSEPQ